MTYSDTTDTGGIPLDLAVTLDGDGASGYAIELSRAWEIWGPNGGYLAALALRAAGLRAELPQPASFYCHFLRSPDFERVELQVRLLKRSRRSEALAVSMRQHDREVLHALVRTAAAAPGYEHQQLRAPSVPPASELKSLEELIPPHKRPPFRFWENVERRPIEQHSARDGPAIVREWTRFRPQTTFADPFVDSARALILLDTYGWPAAYRTHHDGRYIAPNLDTCVWFHHFGRQTEWLLIDHACPVGEDGLLGVGGRVWDEQGRLVASGGAQLCCMPVSAP